MQPQINSFINQGVGNAPPPPMQTGQKNDPTGTPVAPYSHGQNGIFYIPQSNSALVSTLIMPRGGLVDTLPVLMSDPMEDSSSGNTFGSRVYDFDTLVTGVTKGNIETFSNQPSGECAVGPTGGLTKLCTILNTMGHYRGSIREVSLFRAGQAYNRLDEMTHRLLNTSQALQEMFGIPDSMPASNAIIMNEMARRLWELLISFRRFFAVQIWTGTPSSNNGQARQIVGMQTHINSGNKRDAYSGAVCTAADSIVINFNNVLVQAGTPNIVRQLEAADYANRVNAERMGLGPVEGVLVMREPLFYELTSILPVVQYEKVLASLAQVQGNTRIVLNATEAQADRDRYRNTYMLPLNGRMVRVVLDDGIPELNSTNSTLPAGRFSSDIYFVPLTVMGGIPATFFQFFNHDNQQARGILERVAPNAFTFTSDGGVFRWHLNYQNDCLGMNFQFAPWLKCKFPMCGWRITNVAYEPTLRNREFDPDSSYFADGGNIASGQPTAQTIYSPWGGATPSQI